MAATRVLLVSLQYGDDAGYVWSGHYGWVIECSQRAPVGSGVYGDVFSIGWRASAVVQDSGHKAFAERKWCGSAVAHVRVLEHFMYMCSLTDRIVARGSRDVLFEVELKLAHVVGGVCIIELLDEGLIMFFGFFVVVDVRRDIVN
jgi:hypothetical protein